MCDRLSMLCSHTKTKLKLVSWATDCRYGHEQGFTKKNCCLACGAIVANVYDKEVKDE